MTADPNQTIKGSIKRITIVGKRSYFRQGRADRRKDLVSLEGLERVLNCLPALDIVKMPKRERDYMTNII